VKHGNLSEHFSRREFACKDGCGFDSVDPDLIDALEELREVVGRPVTINSGCRCWRHNADIGGSAQSLHLVGRAADIVIVGVSPESVAWIAYALELFSGIKRYGTWAHVDVREGARWRSGF
jgi:uncharacterized protein YcbK (DUF882 family)